MTALPSPGTTASATGIQMQYGNSSHLTTTMQTSLIASPRTTSVTSLSSPSFNVGLTIGNSKRKRRPAGTPDPDAEIVALSPKTLMESDRYVCEICNQGFQRDQNLQMHRRKHKVPWKLLKRSSSEVRKRVYVCPDPSCLHHDPCHALGDLVGIKKHYRRKHSCDKQWTCEKCSKAYAVQSDFKAHLKTCGTRGHCCDCGRVFSRVESFIEHQDACSAAREKTAVASNDQTSLASLSAKDGSASPSADTVSVNNRSVGGVIRSLDSASRYESATWPVDHRELQLLPAKQYIEFAQSSRPICSVDRQGKAELFAKETEAAFGSQARLVASAPTLPNSCPVAIQNDKDAAPPRLQLSIGLYYESSHEIPCTEEKESLSKNGTAPERLASWSDLPSPSLTRDASVTSGSRRSSTTTDNEVHTRLDFSHSRQIRNETPELKVESSRNAENPNNEAHTRLDFSHSRPIRNETPELKVETSRNAENPTALELRTNPGAIRGTTENDMLAVQESEVVEDRGNCKLTWTSFEAATPVRSEVVATLLKDMRWDSWRELLRSQAEVSTSGSATATTSRIREEHVEDEQVGEMRRQAREQLRQAAAYADEARKRAKTQMELAQADLRNASRIREHAQAQLLQAYLMQQQAIRRIDSSRLQITCQACRQDFHLQVASPFLFGSSDSTPTPFNPTPSNRTDLFVSTEAGECNRLCAAQFPLNLDTCMDAS